MAHYRAGSEVENVLNDRNTSRREKEEDEDEAMKWAALERLPTHDRVRKAMLRGITGGFKEIDMKDLSLVERRELFDRVVAMDDDDWHGFYLRRLKRRTDRVSLKLPTIEVRFENVNVTTEAFEGSRAVPTVINSYVSVAKVNISFLFKGVATKIRVLRSKKATISILKDVSGIIKPGRLTLLLGPPGSGKSTLLKALSGKIESGLKCTGKVTYNGHEMHEFVPERTAAYIGQYDVHMPKLTVRETLKFSAKCQGVGTGYDMLEELLRREKKFNIKPDPYLDALMKASVIKEHKENVVTDYVLKLLGLETCADTIVGDHMERGISGGQKKRVTTGEMLVGPVGAYFMDNISDGLDSSTTFQIVNDELCNGADQVHKWLTWAYWTSPFMYIQTAVSVNEFRSKSWKDGLGVAILNSRGFLVETYWYWIGLLAVIIATTLSNIVTSLCLAFLKRGQYGVSKSAVLRDESEEADSNAYSSLATKRTSNDKKLRIPFKPLYITFENIMYSVDTPHEMKKRGIKDEKLVLLNGLSGAFRPGHLTALMGMSGAGKTTLMDVLAGRKNTGYITGDINVSGFPKKQDSFARISGYCEQFDIHSPLLTVYESLLYSAWLRLPPNIDASTRELFIEEVMELIELEPLRGMLVGYVGISGLSTEQRKRMTIAVELVANPSILFMDEPTSGLDARAAAIVMRTVRNTVDTGRTVVCTIHQPSIDIFESFDELFLLARGGEEIYVGPIGHNSSQLIEYFEGIRGVGKIKEGYNPATWALEVTTREQEDILGVKFAQEYKNSNLYKYAKLHT
ncbi:hypothetical protein F2Q70_00032067 [Brassica cretica]|uniref:ABC transporter domain-containing protein n=1 Tax=Brassica cretica TaxID=69181 RepID=A0A8S9FKY0_BRACR|nr:hypothetical protein F2Q70_00032067 [Brassica cretica]